jgi:hypothetical protein
MNGGSFFRRLKQGLTKSRESWTDKIGAILQNRRWDEDSLAEMEESLIAADVGVKASEKLIAALRRRAPNGSDVLAQEMASRLQEAMVEMLQAPAPPKIPHLSSMASAKPLPLASSRHSTAAPAKKFCWSLVTLFVPRPSSSSTFGGSALASTSSNIVPAPILQQSSLTACKRPKVAVQMSY